MIVLLTALACAAPGSHAEALTTSDGLKLVADVYPAKDADGVVLLHMIPPHWDRASWPLSFISALHDTRGLAVCVPDRRGAGDSGGEPKDAYLTVHGRYDVAACVVRLQHDGLKKLVVIGASNGTTSMIDYAVWANEAGLPVPSALGFMTGGSYTEHNTPLKQLAAIPAIFTFSTAERAWSSSQASVSQRWVLKEYPGGAHGTKMFDAKPAVAAELLGFIDTQLGPR